MNRKCKCSLPSKVNGKYAYKCKCRSICIIYEVTCSMCAGIYIRNTQQTFKKILDGRFSDLQLFLKNRQKSDSFAADLVQQLNNTTSCKDLHKCMIFMEIKELNLIGAMKTFTKNICNLWMQERLTILKSLRNKYVTVMKKNRRLMGCAGTKWLSINFS